MISELCQKKKYRMISYMESKNQTQRNKVHW